MFRSSEDSETSPAALRKRAVRKRTSLTSARVATTDRKEVVQNRVTAEQSQSQRVGNVELEVSKTEKRKAPTPFAGAKAAAVNKKKHIIVATILLVGGFGASAMIGFTDRGQIDVQKTIEERNERIRNNQADERDLIGGRVEVPVQNTNVQKADGGLIGRGVGSVSAAPVASPTASTSTSSNETATSSEASATSTESIIVNTEAEEESGVAESD